MKYDGLISLLEKQIAVFREALEWMDTIPSEVPQTEEDFWNYPGRAEGLTRGPREARNDMRRAYQGAINTCAAKIREFKEKKREAL